MTAIGNTPWATPSNMYGRTSDTLGTGAGQRLAATTGGAEGTNKLWLHQ